MAGRPRTVSDTDILTGALRAIGRVGPAALTLADVGREVGLSPATLLQRFGSKRGLLLAVAEEGVRRSEAAFAEKLAEVRTGEVRALEALLAALVEGSAEVATPETMANHLAFLQLDLQDAELLLLAREQAEKERAGIEALVELAFQRGELSDEAREARALARAVQTCVRGSLLSWALFREGELSSWLRRDLELLLGVALAEPTSRRRSAR